MGMKWPGNATAKGSSKVISKKKDILDPPPPNKHPLTLKLMK